jgi:hypothetical protein
MRRVWDAALQSRIDKYNTRIGRYDGIERDERLNKLIPGIERRRDRFISRLYANLPPEHQRIVDGLSPPGKVRAWACSNREF